uniref:Uncharacterized protein n=2 Tax=Aegilops tauschii subsp. strangulata TaxID=200361 RepID=A0A453KBX0_AEGTS
MIFVVVLISEDPVFLPRVKGGGESLNQLTQRCVAYLNKIAQQHMGERVIMVSHDAATVELCRHTDPPGSSVRRNVPNTSLNVFHVSGVNGQWVLTRFGDVRHLFCLRASPTDARRRRVKSFLLRRNSG